MFCYADVDHDAMFCVVQTHSIDAVIITSCSFMLMPSMTSYYANVEHDAMFYEALTHGNDAVIITSNSVMPC